MSKSAKVWLILLMFSIGLIFLGSMKGDLFVLGCGLISFMIDGPGFILTK